MFSGKFNVTIGDIYDYSVTVTNFLGPTNVNDSISKFLPNNSLLPCHM